MFRNVWLHLYPLAVASRANDTAHVLLCPGYFQKLIQPTVPQTFLGDVGRALLKLGKCIKFG